MGKGNKNKNKTKDTKDPVKLKVLSLPPFLFISRLSYRKTVTKHSRIKSMTKPLIGTPRPQKLMQQNQYSFQIVFPFLSNTLGAMAYISIEDFDKAIEDCNQAIQLKPDFAKVGYPLFLSFRLTTGKLLPTEKSQNLKGCLKSLPMGSSSSLKMKTCLFSRKKFRMN